MLVKISKKNEVRITSHRFGLSKTLRLWACTFAFPYISFSKIMSTSDWGPQCLDIFMFKPIYSKFFSHRSQLMYTWRKLHLVSRLSTSLAWLRPLPKRKIWKLPVQLILRRWNSFKVAEHADLFQMFSGNPCFGELNWPENWECVSSALQQHWPCFIAEYTCSPLAIWGDYL